MAKYRKKPVIVEAIQFDGSIKSYDEIEANFGSTVAAKCSGGLNSIIIEIQTLEGIMKAQAGDYIIKGIKGELYSCKPDIFEQTYELVE